MQYWAQSKTRHRFDGEVLRAGLVDNVVKCSGRDRSAFGTVTVRTLSVSGFSYRSVVWLPFPLTGTNPCFVSVLIKSCEEMPFEPHYLSKSHGGGPS